VRDWHGSSEAPLAVWELLAPPKSNKFGQIWAFYDDTPISQNGPKSDAWDAQHAGLQFGHSIRLEQFSRTKN
jgi:hypothetical protein